MSAVLESVADSGAPAGPRASSSSLRCGSEYLRSLNDGRAVYVDGELVKDVTRHPAFKASAESAARLFDTASSPEMRERMTFTSPTSGNPVFRAHQIPRTHADLRAKRLASETWSEGSFGMIGRTPDHVGGFFCGYAAVPEVFAAGGEQFGRNVVRFHEHLRENHLWATYAIVPPQIDRSKPAHKQDDPQLYAGVVRERDDGIVLGGAQQLATAGVLSDYLYLSCIHPLQPGDENYAIGVAIPISTPGLRIYPRRPYALQAPNSFDYPLSSRFDETDCFVVLKDVFVPWENVFIYRNTAVCRDQWWKTPAHSYGNLQAQARYVTKLRFMIGLLKRMNEMTGNEGHPQVQVQMGEIAAMVSIFDSVLESQETRATIDKNGVLWPCKSALYSVMALQSEMNPRMIDIMRELTGSAMISLPSSVKDMTSPETADDINRYMRSATTDARSRIALMRMAWDFVGTEFGNRSQQYEKFYGGASFLVKQNMYRAFDFARSTAMVDAALELPAVE